jgi:hypothetical protein
MYLNSYDHSMDFEEHNSTTLRLYQMLDRVTSR